MLREGFYSDNFKIDYADPSVEYYSFTGDGSDDHNSTTHTIDILLTGSAQERVMTYDNDSLPNSGYLRLQYNLIKVYPTDFTNYIRAQVDSSNYYEFRIQGDNLSAEYVRKYVSGSQTDATSQRTGSVVGTPNSPPSGGEACDIDVVVECWWSHNYMKLITTSDEVEGSALELTMTNDTSELDISDLYMPFTNGDVKIESLQVRYFTPKIDKQGNIMCFNFSEVELNPSIDGYGPEMRIARDKWSVAGEFKEKS